MNGKQYVTQKDLKPYESFKPVGVGAILSISSFAIFGIMGFTDWFIWALIPLPLIHSILVSVRHYKREIRLGQTFARQNYMCSRCHKPFERTNPNWETTIEEIYHKNCTSGNMLGGI